MDQKNQLAKHAGSCHCGAVKFQARLDATAGSRCNCTVCTKLATLGAIVKPDAFELLSGEQNLTAYEWGGRTAKRYFCEKCGVTCFSRGYLEQIGGDYVAINLNALDDVDPAQVKVAYFDGRHNNWEAGVRDTPWPIRS